jgi:hypothetical protein
MEILFVLAIVAVVIGLAVFGAYMSAKRRKELMAWAESKGLRYTQGKRRGVDSRFAEFKCLHKGKNRYAYDVMEGEWSERPIVAFDYHYETESRDSKGRRQRHHHHFSAVILGNYFPLKPLFIRPEGFFDKVTEFLGLDDIDFESAEFSRKFFVKAQDRRWAFDVIHARTMQFLLDMPRFTIQFDPAQVIAYRSSKFTVGDFEAAAGLIQGMLDRFPDYLVKQLQEEG